jgi:cupin 2 domain-containing protein
VTPAAGNLYAGIPSSLPAELVEPLAASAAIRVERIVSHGHASPDGFWYDQDRDEFVLLVAGAARLRFEGEADPVALGPGDYLTIPARRRHRVEWTTPDGPTVWLAVHYEG